mgnify:FL=1
MRKDGFMKSGIYRVLDYIARLVILNVLILIISFLLLLIFKDQKWPLIITALTFLPSIVSAFKVIKDYEDGKNPSIFKPFFMAFKKYYVKSLIYTVIILVIAVLLLNSYSVFNAHYSEGVAYIIGYYLTLSVILVAILGLVQLPLVLVNFDGLGLLQYLKLSIILGFKDILSSAISVVIIGLLVLVGVVYPTILAVIGISGGVYLITKLTYRKYSVLSSRHSSVEE